MYQTRPWRDFFSIKVMRIFCVWLLWTRNWALFSNARYLTDCHVHRCLLFFFDLKFLQSSHPLWVFSPNFRLCISVSKKNQTNINFLKKVKTKESFEPQYYILYIYRKLNSCIYNKYFYLPKHTMWLFFTHTTNFCLHYLWWFSGQYSLG